MNGGEVCVVSAHLYPTTFLKIKNVNFFRKLALKKTSGCLVSCLALVSPFDLYTVGLGFTTYQKMLRSDFLRINKF